MDKLKVCFCKYEWQYIAQSGEKCIWIHIWLFTHHSSLRYPFYRAALKLCISIEAARYFENLSALINSAQINFHPFFLIPVSPPTSFTPPPLSKEQIPPVWAIPLRLLWNRLPLWQKGKKKGSLPCSVHEFCTYASQYLPFWFPNEKLSFVNAGCHYYAANYAKTKWEKQITPHKPHTKNYLQKVIPSSLLLLRLPNISKHKKQTILPNHLNLNCLLFVDVILQQVTSAGACYRQSTREATTLPTHGGLVKRSVSSGAMLMW